MKKVLLLLLLLCAAPFVFADEPQTQMKHDCKEMGCDHGDMKAMHDKMMGDMKAMDAKLDELVAAMNTATGDKKVEAMSSLLTEMVSQRKKMQQMMMMAAPHGPHAMMGCGHEGGPMGKEGGMGCCMGNKDKE